MDIATFRSVFPEFSNTTTYTDAAITFWLNTGLANLNACVWKTQQDEGLLYYIAHNLVIAQRRAATAAVGGVPGTTQGPIASKGVDKVNIGYTTEAVTLENGGMYNQTDYGIQFLKLARMVGAQGVQNVITPTGAAYYGVFGGI